MLWFVGIFAAPYLTHISEHYSFLYYIYSFVCHQDPARSFHLWGYKLGVCSRCTGIYSGALFFILAFPFWKPKLNARNVIILFVPLLVGKLMEKITGFSTNVERFISGFPFGIVVGMGFLYGLEALIGGLNEG